MNKSFLSGNDDERFYGYTSTEGMTDRKLHTEIWIIGDRRECSTISVDLNESQKIDETYGDSEKMLAAIRGCAFEPCVWTRADELFESMVYGAGAFDKPMKVLADIVNKHLTDEHILEGVLHILSNYQYDEINPIGITIAIACKLNASAVVQDLLITCLEKWDSYETISLLEELELRQRWLSDYRDSVVEQLKQGY